MTLDRSVVLLLTHSADHYVPDLVHSVLRSRGADPVRVDTDLYPTQLAISSELDGAGESHRVAIGDRTIEARTVRAVWTRRIWTPAMDESLEPQYRDGCIRNAAAARDGFLGALAHARWVNPIGAVREAYNKIHQLRVAQAAGLRVPRTLVTNNPVEARAFFESLGGRMVAKLLVNLSARMEHAAFFVRTTEVTEEHLKSLDRLRHCPMIFQERVPKARELRVAYVAGRRFTGAIEAVDLPDWRLGAPGDYQWRRGELAEEIAGRLRGFMNSLGLVYGAVDFIESDAGPPVFLEVNPTGEWGMLQKCLDLPIAEAIVEALLMPEAGA